GLTVRIERLAQSEGVRRRSLFEEEVEATCAVLPGRALVVLDPPGDVFRKISPLEPLGSPAKRLTVQTVKSVCRDRLYVLPNRKGRGDQRGDDPTPTRRAGHRTPFGIRRLVVFDTFDDSGRAVCRGKDGRRPVDESLHVRMAELLLKHSEGHESEPVGH